MKIAINRCYGGFGISQKCYERLVELGYVLKEPYPNMPADHTCYWAAQDRTDPIMIQAIEELGEEANGSCARIVILEIPDNVPYEISGYDGVESIEAPRQFYG